MMRKFFLLILLLLITASSSWAVFPQVPSITQTSFETATTDHAVSMPTTVESGDLLLCIWNTGNGTVSTTTTPSGWTAVAATTFTNGVAGVYAKVSDGAEGGTTVNFVTSAATAAVAQVYRIAKNTWYGDIAIGVETAHAGPTTSTTPDPPNLDPANWGTLDTLWIAVSYKQTSQATTAYPTNYTNTTETTELNSSVTINSARRELNAASENPGTFTLVASRSWVARTIAIRPHERRIW